MRKIISAIIIATMPSIAKADFFGGDLPLLAEIVTNTLHTMQELERQSRLMEDEMRGINDRIHRIQTIADVIKPEDWDKWKDPREAVNRLRTIYYAVPKEYRSEKYDQIEQELSKALNLLARISPEIESTFNSGKELENRGTYSSPGVAQKLTASGVGTLIALESQSQIIQSHITSLLAQILANGNERETRAVTSRGKSFQNFSESLSQKSFAFSSLVLNSGKPK